MAIRRTIPSEENHIRPDLLDHLLRHFALTGDLRPSGCCLANFVDDPCGILDVVLGRAFEQIVFGDAAEFAVYRHLVGRGPLSVGIVGVAHVVGWRKVPFPASVHQERDVLRVVVLVAYHDIEHHSAEHFLRLLVGEPQTAHCGERLFVGVGPEEPVIEVCDAAECLHVHLCSVYPVEPLCQEMGPPVLFDQRAFRHVDAAFSYKTREGFVSKGFSGYIHQRIDLYPNIRIYGIDGRLEFKGSHAAFAQKTKRPDRIAAGPARQGKPFLKEGPAVCIRQGVRQHPGQAFEGRFIELPETVHTPLPYGHHQR